MSEYRKWVKSTYRIDEQTSGPGDKKKTDSAVARDGKVSQQAPPPPQSPFQDTGMGGGSAGAGAAGQQQVGPEPNKKEDEYEKDIETLSMPMFLQAKSPLGKMVVAAFGQDQAPPEPEESEEEKGEEGEENPERRGEVSEHCGYCGEGDVEEGRERAISTNSVQRMKSDPAFRHQVKVARDTLKMNPAMAGVMGGMTPEEARNFLKANGLREAFEVKPAPGDWVDTSFTSGTIKKIGGNHVFWDTGLPPGFKDPVKNLKLKGKAPGGKANVWTLKEGRLMEGSTLVTVYVSAKDLKDEDTHSEILRLANKHGGGLTDSAGNQWRFSFNTIANREAFKKTIARTHPTWQVKKDSVQPVKEAGLRRTTGSKEWGRMPKKGKHSKKNPRRAMRKAERRKGKKMAMGEMVRDIADEAVSMASKARERKKARAKSGHGPAGKYASGGTGKVSMASKARDRKKARAKSGHGPAGKYGIKGEAMNEAYMVFSFVTHNGKYSVKAIKESRGMTGDVTLQITDKETGRGHKETYPSEKAARKRWQEIHKGNLKPRNEITENRQTEPQKSEGSAKRQALKMGFGKKGYYVMDTPEGWVAIEYANESIVTESGAQPLLNALQDSGLSWGHDFHLDGGTHTVVFSNNAFATKEGARRAQKIAKKFGYKASHPALESVVTEAGTKNFEVNAVGNGWSYSSIVNAPNQQAAEKDFMKDGRFRRMARQNKQSIKDVELLTTPIKVGAWVGGAGGAKQKPGTRRSSFQKRWGAENITEAGALPQDLSKASSQQLKGAVDYLVKLPTKELRRRQDLTDAQIRKAYQQKNEKALGNLQIMRQVLDAAVDKREFGEAVDTPHSLSHGGNTNVTTNPVKTDRGRGELTQQELDIIDRRWKEILAFAKKAFAGKPYAIAVRAIEQRLERAYNISNENSGQVAATVADILNKDYSPKSRAFQKVHPKTSSGAMSQGSGYIPMRYPPHHTIGAVKLGGRGNA